MSAIETIEQKLLRLNSTRTGMADNRSEGYFSFSVVCELLEMAIAEEREACAKICDGLHRTWRWDDEPDSESGPRQCAMAIRKRAAQKDEASE